MSEPNAYYKVKPGLGSAIGYKFISWGAQEPLTDGFGPCEDPVEPVWFEFGETETAAIEALQKAMREELGPLVFHRMEFSTKGEQCQ